jgi:ribosomal protein S27AE
MSPENHEMAHGQTIGTAPTSNESNKNVVTWRGINIIQPLVLTRKLDMTIIHHASEMHDMDAIVCSRCGFAEVALVRKEMLGSGKYRKKWHCPRCSNTWETVDK